VQPDRVYVDHGITGTHRQRPALREALAACRPGDTLVVTKLDRLARSIPDARDIVNELTARGVRLDLGGCVHDPTDPIGRLLFTVLSMIAEFEADLARAGLAPAKAWPSPRPRAGYAANSPSSSLPARPSSSRSGGPATTPPSSSPRCSTSPAPPSTGPSNVLPANSDALTVPAGLLWQFRLLALGTSALLWGTLSVVFGLPTARDQPGLSRARPVREPVAV